MVIFRNIRPLGWFISLWIGFTTWNYLVYYWEHVPATPDIASLAFILLTILHLGIYWYAFAFPRRQNFCWPLLLIQTLLVLALIQITHHAGIALCFSLPIIIMSIDLFKQLGSILLALALYSAFLLLLMCTSSTMMQWSILWTGEAVNYELLALFILAILILSVQQERAHERKHTLLQELDTTYQQLKEAHNQLSAYMLRIEELTAINERQRIARDLHDTLVQGTVGLIMQLEVVSTQLRQQRTVRAQETLQHVMEAARDALADARCAIGTLREEHLCSEDLIDIIQEAVQHLTSVKHIASHTDLAALVSIPSTLCEHIQRVMTEALTNITRHANAHHVSIMTTRDATQLTIEICDDGIGFDPTLIEKLSGHYGLLGIRERCKLIGARLTITSTLGSGTHLCVQIPLHQEGAATCSNVSAFLSPTII